MVDSALYTGIKVFTAIYTGLFSDLTRIWVGILRHWLHDMFTLDQWVVMKKKKKKANERMAGLYDRRAKLSSSWPKQKSTDSNGVT